MCIRDRNTTDGLVGYGISVDILFVSRIFLALISIGSIIVSHTLPVLVLGNRTLGGFGCVSVDEVKMCIRDSLADPHGTHKKGTDAVLAAIDEEKKAGAEWLKDCRIWMYRGCLLYTSLRRIFIFSMAMPRIWKRSAVIMSR